jgi:hypothetical protein
MNVTPNGRPRRLRGSLTGLFVLAALLLGLWPGSADAGVVIQVDNSTAPTGGSGTFDVILSNTGTSAQTVSGFSVELSVAAASGVEFTGVTAVTTAAPYIFGTLTNANAINNHDQIVGVGTYQGHQEAYLLTIGADSGTTPGNGHTTPPPSPGAGGSAPVPPHATQVVAASRTKKGLTAITVAFDEALDSVSVSNSALYNVLGAVKKHRKTVYSKGVGIQGIGFDGSTPVTIRLARPYKGAVQVTVAGGILAADGASTDINFSSVID